MKRLIVDMDNVLNNMAERLVREFNKTFGTNFSIVDITSYRFYENFGVDLEVGHNFTRTLFNWPGFWLSLEPQPNSTIIMRKLNDIFDIYVVTTPFKRSRNCFAEKVDWLNKYFPFIGEEKLVFTYNKGLIKGDIIIDDHPTNLSNFVGNTIVFDYPFNKEFKADFRSDNWIEIGQFLINNK